MDERKTRAGTPERRDHSPPGRLRRIHFAYRGGTWRMLGAVALATVLLVATTAWAVNERFKREVARDRLHRTTRARCASSRSRRRRGWRR